MVLRPNRYKVAQRGSGFQIENIDSVLTKLQEIGDTTPPLIQSTSSYRRVFLLDPDGRKVMLTEI